MQELIEAHSNDITLICDSNLQIIHGIKETLEKALGYSLQDVERRFMRKIIHPDDYALSNEAIKTIMDGKKNAAEFQARLLHKNGFYYWFKCKIYAYDNPRGEHRILILGININDWKIQEDELKLAQKQLGIILEHAADIIVLFDSNQNVLFGNEVAIQKNLGYTLDEIDRMVIPDIIHLDDLEEFLKKLESIHDSQNILLIDEVRLKHKDGSYLWFEMESVSFRDESRSRRTLFIARNIQDKKVQQIQLRKSEEKFRLISENATDLIALIDLKTNTFDFINKNSFQKISEYSLEELKDATPFDFIHPDDVERIRKSRTEINACGTWSYLARLITKSGTTKWLEWKAKRLINPEGTIKSLVVARDITGRKIAQDKIKESERKLRSLIENSPNSIILVDENGFVTDCNKATEEIVNIPAEQLRGKQLLELADIINLNAEWIEKQFTEIISRIKDKSSIQIPIVKRDGSKLWAESKITPLKIGNARFYLVVSHDITNLKNAEVLVKEELEKVKELDNLRSEFIYRVSHELKTPISTICGVSEILLDQLKDSLDENSKTLLDLIMKGGKRLKSLTEKLLDVLRSNRDQFDLDLQPTDIIPIIKDIEEFQHLLKERKLNITFDLPPSCIIDVDRVRFEQVMTNLISNAIKNTPPSGSITISIDEYQDFIKILVKDTGVGITEEEMEKLFTLFGKIERYGRGDEIISEGTGLGLHIVSQLVSRHGGDVWVESEGYGRGSTFIVKFFRKKKHPISGC
ncbi:MAG: PAS domain S-box protein [Promethearchaeota archaeon]